MRKVFILSGKRTPFGLINSCFKTTPVIKLGEEAVSAAIDASYAEKGDIKEMYMGNVFSSGVGANIAMQLAHHVRLEQDISCLSINDLCASGMKAISLANTGIKIGQSSLSVAGGLESSSQAPHIVQIRKGASNGDTMIHDSTLHDGSQTITEIETQAAKQLGLSQTKLRDFSLKSFERLRETEAKKAFEWEVQSCYTLERLYIETDSVLEKKTAEKFAASPPEIAKAADGACALVLASDEYIEKHSLDPLAEILAVADIAVEPENFMHAPTLAAKKALEQLDLSSKDISLWEIHERTAIQALAFAQSLSIPLDKLNVHGGALSLGNPSGASGTRVLLSLLNALRLREQKYGIAVVGNILGGATAVLVKSLPPS